jgi:hypothetical protein
MRNCPLETPAEQYQTACSVVLIRSDWHLSMTTQQKQEHPEHKFPWKGFFIGLAIAALVFIAIFFFVFLRVGGG